MGKKDHVVIVGGGLAGLAASIHLARGGKAVTLFERSPLLGGRATTQLYEGFRFNLGPHALHASGVKALRELGISFHGKKPSRKGIAIRNNEHHELPGGPISLISTTLLSGRSKMEMLRLLVRLLRMKPQNLDDVSLTRWLDESVAHEDLREVMTALFRLSTFSSQPDEESAAAAITQLQKAVRHGVLYVDEGWQTLVDGLRAAAISSGVNFVNSSRVVSVRQDGKVRGVELGGLQTDEELDRPLRDTMTGTVPVPSEHGASVNADAVILAIPPRSAAKLVGATVSPTLATSATRCVPLKAASLDLGLTKLPRPAATFALGLDLPLYFSVHSAAARLAPAGGAMLHAMRYLKEGESAEEREQELETLVDDIQPGWRDFMVRKRYIPNLTVSNAMVTASNGGLHGRMPVRVPEVENLYVAGDWAGDEGMLSDASFASARRAARMILGR